MMGALRARPRSPPLRSRKSETKPDNSTPRNAARNGTEA